VQLSKTAFGSQWESYYAPTIEGGVVYSNCGSYGGMCAFSLADGTQNWFASLSQFDAWTPAVDENYVYSYLGGVLSALVKSTGQVAFTIRDPKFEFDGSSTHGSPVLGTNGSVIALSGRNLHQDNRLISFNTVTRAVNWSITGRYGGNPVLAKGVVYAINVPAGSYRVTLEARKETTGALLWRWTPPGDGDGPLSGYQGDHGELLVTDNLIFVATNKHVYAVDLATRASVWSYWKGGTMALSANGVLYIDTGGTIGAVNLK
jgi:hypothetical protein